MHQGTGHLILNLSTTIENVRLFMQGLAMKTTQPMRKPQHWKSNLDDTIGLSPA
jgi:hypothetical protein